MAVDVNEILALPEEERRMLHFAIEQSLIEQPSFDLTDEELEQIRQDLEACRKDPSLLLDARQVVAELRRRV